MLHIEPKFSIATYIEDKSDTVLDMKVQLCTV